MTTTANPASTLTREDYNAIRDVLLAYRKEGVVKPLLPTDVDLDGDGTVDSYGLNENDELIFVTGIPLEETVYVSDGNDIPNEVDNG